MSVSWPFPGRRFATITTRLQRRPERSWSESGQVQSIRHRRDRGPHATHSRSKARGHRVRVGDHAMSEGVGRALHGNLHATLARGDFPPAADANRYAAERGRGKEKDVRVQIRGVHQRDPPLAAPSCERSHLRQRVSASEARDRKRRHGSGALCRALEPRAVTSERDEMHLPATAGSRRRTNSIICRSVPPGWKLGITIAIGRGRSKSTVPI